MSRSKEPQLCPPHSSVTEKENVQRLTPPAQLTLLLPGLCFSPVLRLSADGAGGFLERWRHGRELTPRGQPQSWWGGEGGGPGWGLTVLPCPPTVELKIEVVLPEKERGKEELSGGKGSPRAYQGNGTARHFHAEERLPAPHPYPGAQDCVEAAVCHVKDLENGQWVLGLGGRWRGPSEGPRWEGKVQAVDGVGWEAWKGPFTSTRTSHHRRGLSWSGPAPQKAELWEELSTRSGAWCVA